MHMPRLCRWLFFAMVSVVRTQSNSKDDNSVLDRFAAAKNLRQLLDECGAELHPNLAVEYLENGHNSRDFELDRLRLGYHDSSFGLKANGTLLEGEVIYKAPMKCTFQSKIETMLTESLLKK